MSDDGWPTEVPIEGYVPGETSVHLTPAAAEALRLMLRDPFNAGYRAGLAAALKALEEWKAQCLKDEFPIREEESWVAPDWAITLVKRLLEEKP